ncbi:hypothetical protein BH23CHL8_BH23CHL8_29560 [soil metagenome]
MTTTEFTRPEAWKGAWDLNPPQPGDPDHVAYRALAPLMIAYHDALLAATPSPGPVQPTAFFDGHRRIVPEADAEPLLDVGEVTAEGILAQDPGPEWSGASDDPVPIVVNCTAQREDDEAWSEVPLPRSLTEMPPPLREDALVGIVGDVARETVTLTGCDPLSPVIHLLAAWGAMAPPHVREAILLQPAREFVLPVGRTGSTRKGTVHACVTRLLRYVDPTLGERTINWQGGSGEGLFARLAKDESEPRALIFADEFGQILAQAQRTGQTVLAAIRSLWNPEGAADIPTRREPIHVEGIHVSAIFHSTPAEVQNGFRSGEVTTGLVNRLLVARLRPAEYRSRTGDYPSEVFERLTDGLAKASAAMASTPALVHYSEDAGRLWEAVKPTLEDHDAPGADILARGAGHVARVALLYALLAGRARIEVEDVRAGLAVWDACRHSAVLLFGAMTGDRDADRIYSILMQMGGTMTRTDLRDALGRHGRRDDIEHALVTLAARGLVRRRQKRTGGRSVERVEVVDLSGRDPRDISEESDISPLPDAQDPAPADPGSLMSPMSQRSRQEPPDRAPDDGGRQRCPACGTSTLVRVPGSDRIVCTQPGHPPPSSSSVSPTVPSVDEVLAEAANDDAWAPA